MTPILEERDVPGGRSFTLHCPGRTDVTTIVRDDGERELQITEKRSGETLATLRMDDDDARRLGAVLTGTRYRPAVPERVRGRLGELVLDWFTIEEGSEAAGRSLGELDLHRRTGMTVIAVVGPNHASETPVADTVLEAGDRVVVVGQLRQLQPLMDLLTS